MVLALVLAASLPWRDSGSHRAAPTATFEPLKPVAAPQTPATASPITTTNEANVDQLAPGMSGGALPEIASVTGATTVIPRSNVTWSNATGAVSGGGLIASYCCAGAYSQVEANREVSSGLHYWEITLSVRTGARNPDTWTSIGVAPSPGQSVVPRAPGAARVNLNAIPLGQSNRYSNGDVFMFALDADSHMAYYGVNGIWQNGDPRVSSGGQSMTGNAFKPFALISAADKNVEGDRWIANFGGSGFKYPVPPKYAPYGTSSNVGSAVTVTQGATPGTAANKASGSLFGQKLVNEVILAGQTVPLPEGEWVGLSHFKGSPNKPQGDSVVLGKLEGGRLVGMIALSAHRHAAGEERGYPAFNACDRTDYVFIDRTSNNANGEQRCWWINHAASPWTEQPVFRAAQTALDARKATVSDLYMNVGFRFASKVGYVTVFYYFDPVIDGITTSSSNWKDSQWNASRIAEDPRRMQYVAKLKIWGRNWAPFVFAKVPS